MTKANSTITDSVIDVFLSRKSADAHLSKELYHFLQDKGLTVFESDETLPRLGSSDYRKAIDQALDECRHMIVVGSSVEYIASSWVEAEWGFYIGEKRAGRKQGNILTVITPNLKIEDLPASLRYYEVIYFKPENFDRIAAYVGKEYADKKYPSPKKRKFKSWLLPAAAIAALILVGGYFLVQSRKPFDATVFVAPAKEMKSNTAYPSFGGGTLSLYLGNRKEDKVVSPGQETVFTQIPAEFRDEKAVVKLNSNYWRLEKDTVTLTESMHLRIIPDGSLAAVYGRVINTRNDQPCDSCLIKLRDTDTVFWSDKTGHFKATLPYAMQKEQHVLTVWKNDKEVGTQDYNPGKYTDIPVRY